MNGSQQSLQKEMYYRPFVNPSFITARLYYNNPYSKEYRVMISVYYPQTKSIDHSFIHIFPNRVSVYHEQALYGRYIEMMQIVTINFEHLLDGAILDIDADEFFDIPEDDEFMMRSELYHFNIDMNYVPWEIETSVDRLITLQRLN